MTITRISDSDLASVALYDKVNQMIDEIEGTTVGYSRISNCLTHIPQDIKLELVDGTVRAEQGSKLWIPYGTTEVYKIGDTDSTGNVVVATSWDGSKFFYAIELRSDLSYSYTGSGDNIRMLFWYNNNLDAPIEYTNTSGSATPSETTQTGMFYNTTDNHVYKVQNGAWVRVNVSLPLSILYSTNGVYASIEQIFNGIGYVGSTVYALPGVKGLIPDYRNADESLRNIEFVNPVVRTNVLAGTYNNMKIALALTGLGVYTYAYDEVKNAIYRTDTGVYYPSDRLIVGDISYTDGVITSFTPKTPFQATDYNDFKRLDDEAVKLIGDQTIDGGKTFMRTVKVRSLFSGSDSYAFRFEDTNNKGYIGAVGYYTGNRLYHRIHCVNDVAGKHAYFDVSVKDDGNAIFNPGGNFSSLDVNFAGASTFTVPTPATSSNGSNVATTAWFNSKIQTVSTAPASPDSNVYYFITG